MKTMGKMMKRGKMFFALLAAIMLQSVPMHAQEMVRSMYNAPTGFTLARTVPSTYNKWVVYNENTEFSLFGLMDTSGVTNYFVKTQQHLHVKDMEIIGGKLYFCGSMYDCNSKNNVGVMGYFLYSQLSTPSNMTISYMVFPEFKELRKMDFFKSISQDIHIVMVGTGMDEVDYVVDAFYVGENLSPSGGYWTRSWMNMPNIDAKFDDIVNTTDSIIVAARVENETEVQLCFFLKYTLGGAFFYGANINVFKLTGQPTGRVLLQRLGEGFFAFYRCGPYLDVHRFQGMNNMFSYRVPILSTNAYFPEYFVLKDVCNDLYKSDEVSVLLSKVYYNTPSHQIYHIPTMYPPTGMVSGHEYVAESQYCPMSLCGGKDYHTLSMGMFLDRWGMARVKNSEFYKCTNQLSKKINWKDVSKEPFSKTKNYFSGEAEFLEMEVKSLDYSIISECGSVIRENNNENEF